jgi:heat shock protein HslJ
MRCVAVSLALLLAFAAGCGGEDDEDDTTAASFVGVPWLLSSGLDVEGWEARPPSATFTDDTVGGFTGCNRFTGPYTSDGDALELGPLASTRMACAPPGDAIERAYLAALERVAAWSLDDEELVLLDGDDAELLRYVGATPVGDWEATAIQTGNALASPLVGTEITASFAGDLTLTGSAGCNTYRTTFTTDSGDIEISPAAATRKTCPTPDGVMEQETAYLAALPTAATYRVDGDSLALLQADGTYVASFVRATP